MLTSKRQVEDKILGLESGADDYITKPFDLDELTARIKSHLRRAKQAKTYNPLTALPGNILIDEQIKNLVYSEKKVVFSVIYIDVDNFKAYNDIYGFLKGDEVLKLLAHILTQVTGKYGAALDFVGHIGGDDFVIITTAEDIDTICKEIISLFDASILLLYNKKDRKKGYITSKDREGNIKKFLIMTLSIAVVTNQHRDLISHWQVSHIAAELKKHAKSISKSIYVKDKRTE